MNRPTITTSVPAIKPRTETWTGERLLMKEKENQSNPAKRWARGSTSPCAPHAAAGACTVLLPLPGRWPPNMAS